MTKIYTVDTLCGSGKTYAAIRYAIQRATRGEKFAIVQPSKDLIEQSFNDCVAAAAEQSAKIKITRLDSYTCGAGQVKKDVINHLKSSGDDGEIIFITHAAFLTMPYWHKAGDWNVLFDELPVVDRDLTKNVPATHGIVTNYISATSCDPTYYMLVADDDQALKKISDNPNRDEVYEVFRDLAGAVTSDHWDVYARKENWARMHNHDSDDGKHKLLCFGLLRPTIFDPFKSATVMGAMLKESVMFHWWQNWGVEFEQHPVIYQQARKRLPAHLNGDHLTIRYLFDVPWSKSFRDQPVMINGGAVDKFDYVKDKMREVFGDEPFLWVANKDVPDARMEEFPSAIRLSNSPHGLNQYQDVHNVVFLSALNPTPAHFSFMETRGIKADDLRDAMVHQITYQSVMRGSLRDTDCTEAKTVMVSDKQTAYWLANSFPGCAIGQVSNPVKVTQKKVGRPAIGNVAMSAAERVRKYREGKRRELACNETPISYSSFVTPTRGTIFASIYAKDGGQITEITDVGEFISELRQCHGDAFDSKDANGLISPAIFDPDKSPDTSRGLGNITHVWGIWLDNDGGDLSWREFQKKFPDLQMVCMNTWTGNDRYRVFIPTTQPMTLECHQHVVSYMMGQLSGYYDDKAAADLASKGRKVKRHGFDVSKFVPCSLFYLPCQAKAPKDSFFVEFAGAALDPYEWGEAAIAMMDDPDAETRQLEFVEEKALPPTGGSEELNAIRNKLAVTGVANDTTSQIRNAIATYTSIPCGMSLRHIGFFTLAAKLKRSGLNDNEIMGHLTLADTDGSRKKKNAIASVMKSLKSAKWAS
jgi:hypothetical protein